MESLSAQDLPRALCDWPDIAVLSLDCFDTLLWRDSHAPSDVFQVIPGVSRQQRRWAEQTARSIASIRDGRTEVTIAEIYAALLPNADEATRNAAISEEIEAEKRACAAFRPTVDLMRAARRRRIPVVIVSDTYLDRHQLGALIRAAAGDEVHGLIDHIFCSSEWGVAKSQGLFRHVLATLKVAADKILHVGDNPGADVTPAQMLGINALHLRQFSGSTEQRLRLEAAMGALCHPRGGKRDLAYQPHRAPLSIAEASLQEPAEAFGFAVIGPVLNAFQLWLAQEAEAVRAASSGRTHILFLMRDGYLSHSIHRAVSTGIDDSHAVDISRFTATASSFVDRESVLRHIAAEGGETPDDMLRTLLFPRHERAAILQKLPRQGRRSAFIRAVQSPHNLKAIFRRSHDMAARLVAHVVATVAPDPGDTLMLVDLGYNGTVQNQIEPLLRQALGCNVVGRYLILREQTITGHDKRGLFDARHYDAPMLEAMCGNVAVLEQLCTMPTGSVIDYTPEGTAIRAEASIKGRQSDVRDAVQRGCIRYAEQQAAALIRRADLDRDESLRRGAAATLTRLMFLPLPDELALLAQFDHDVNLGLEAMVPLFDPDVAARGMRDHGLFYMKDADRMYLPAELRGQGMAASMTLIAQRCFGLSLSYADFCDSGIDLPLLIANGRDVAIDSVRATPTHDGYMMAAIPIGRGQFAIGVQFGRLYDWLQIASVRFLPAGQVLSGAEDAAPAIPTLEGMEQCAPYLFHCHDAESFMMVPPPRHADELLVLAVVFRPIVSRIAASVPVFPAQAIAGAVH